MIQAVIFNLDGVLVTSHTCHFQAWKLLAEEQGMTVDEYMNSPYNPRMGDFLRAAGVELKCDGAAACIVCATDMIPQIAPNLKHAPIEVLGIGSSAL